MSYMMSCNVMHEPAVVRWLRWCAGWGVALLHLLATPHLFRAPDCSAHPCADPDWATT